MLTSDGTPVFAIVSAEVRLAALELNGKFTAEFQHALGLAELEGVAVGCIGVGSVNSLPVIGDSRDTHWFGGCPWQ